MRQIEPDKLFGNIEEVYKASCQFWMKHMSLVVRRSRETGQQLDCCLLKPGFISVCLLALADKNGNKTTMSLLQSLFTA